MTMSEKRGNFEQNKKFEILVSHIIENTIKFEDLIRFQIYSYLKLQLPIHFLLDM